MKRSITYGLIASLSTTLFAACGGTSEPSSSSSNLMATTVACYTACGNTLTSALTPPSGPGKASGYFPYGRHYPQGVAAVDYIYGPDGTWKRMNVAEYRWNYYNYSDNPANHPYDKAQLIAYANGTHFTMARDANRHLLLDLNHNGEIDVTDGGYAFHEHNGKGTGGASKATPFTNFWYDDNWLARYMSEAYGRSSPNGLSQYNDFNRWQIIGGDTSYWTPYTGSSPDQLALNGLYYLRTGSVSNAMTNWNKILTYSSYSYNSATRRYLYPSLVENYHLGLFEVLTAQLMNSGSLSTDQYSQLLQHWVSIRSNLLARQEHNSSGAAIGWMSSTSAGTLINTESVAAGVLGLGAGASATYEVGQGPMQYEANNYFYRPYFVLSAAVEGQSRAGYMAYGPYHQYPRGSFKADFILRAPSPFGKVATLDIYDSRNGQVLAVKDVYDTDLSGGDIWKSISLSFQVANSTNSLEFRIRWNGISNMDAAAIRVH